ncbi:hypothetical protein C5E45_20195 [Nocardia nova]|uniref:SecDF P1 head subdomain domain-containing protein n=2 Tax=Nocardia nova TaxID=37330 RepID=A0A2S6AMB2_9NOCA|nr:hypothetical protein C5E45_20195 [Nocardia nova]
MDLHCKQTDPLRGNDDPHLPLVTCNSDGTHRLILEPSRLDGTEITSATPTTEPGRDAGVTIKFKSADAWARLTTNYPYHQIAFTIDTTVVSAPVIQPGTQLGAETTISGNLTPDQAKELARTINQSTLPLAAHTTVIEVLRPTR